MTTRLLEKPKGRGACPTFFFATCLTASQGGSNGYYWAGHKLASSIAGLEPDWIDEDLWVAELEKLQALIVADGDNGPEIIAWFERWVPRCMAMIPQRRREAFLKGVYAYVIDEGNAVDEY